MFEHTLYDESGTGKTRYGREPSQFVAPSPACNINPDSTGSGPSLDISEANNRPSVEPILSASPFFGLDRNAAKRRLNEIFGVVSR